MKKKTPMIDLRVALERRIAGVLSSVGNTLASIGRLGRRKNEATAAAAPLEPLAGTPSNDSLAAASPLATSPATASTPDLAPLAVAALPDSVESAPTTLTTIPDPELDALRARIVWMEKRVFDLDARKSGMDLLIEEHAFLQYQAVGDLLAEHLRLQQEVLHLRAEHSLSEQDRQAAQAAAEEYAAYQSAERGSPLPEVVLADDEQEELKALYRAAAMRCHPDRVEDADKPRAHEMFLRTQAAYRQCDLEALRRISQELGADPQLSKPEQGTNALARLKAFLDALESKGVDLAIAIESLQTQAHYRSIRLRENWPDQFATLRAQLDQDCATLRREIARG